jgi:hypothetical protein
LVLALKQEDERRKHPQRKPESPRVKRERRVQNPENPESKY